MKPGKFTGAEFRVMAAFWRAGHASIREVLESFPAKRRPAYTTVQTLVYRLEEKGALRRTKKIGGAHIFEPVVSREMTGRKLLDEVLDLFGGRTELLMSHLIESGKLTHADVEAAKRLLSDAGHDEPDPPPKE